MGSKKAVLFLSAYASLAIGCAGNNSEYRKGLVNGIPVEAKSFRDVDVLFSRATSEGANKAMHSGKAMVVEGCLFVGDSIVVWPKGSEKEVEAIVEDARRPESKVISLGGGGISEDEGRTDLSGADVRCSFSGVWFAHEILGQEKEKQ